MSLWARRREASAAEHVPPTEAPSPFVYDFLKEQYEQDPINANKMMQGVKWWPDFVADLKAVAAGAEAQIQRGVAPEPLCFLRERMFRREAQRMLAELPAAYREGTDEELADYMDWEPMQLYVEHVNQVKAEGGDYKNLSYEVQREMPEGIRWTRLSYGGLSSSMNLCVKIVKGWYVKKDAGG